MKFEIATKKDLQELYEVMLDTGLISFKYKDLDKNQVLKKMESDYFDKDVVVVIARTKKIIAYSIFGPYKKYKEQKEYPDYDNAAYSLGTGVFKEFRGGTGAKIRIETDKIARKKRYDMMITSVATTNAASIKVQEKCGFTKIAEFEDTKRENGVGTIIFMKKL